MPISVPFIPTITSAGLTAIFNAQSTGVEFALSHIAFGTAQYTPDGTETALQAEKVRVPIAGGGPISPTQIQIYAVAMAAAGDPFFVGEVGFFGDNGATLLAVYSSTSPPTLFLSDTVSTSVSYALGLAALPANSVTVTIDPSASAALLILGQHVASADPHPQYVEKVNGAAFYDATVTFVEDALVVGDDGLVYQSLQNANIGHVPSTSPTWWGPVSVPPATANKHAVQLQQAQTMRGQMQSVSTLDASASVGAGAIAGAVLYYFGNTANQTITLPPRASVISITDRSITKFVNTSSVSVTIAPTGGEQIGGGTGESLTSIVLAPGDDLQLLAASEFSAWAAIGGSALRQFNPLVVANATAAQDAVPVAQLQSGAPTYAVAGGTANALTVNLTPAITKYAPGMAIRVNITENNAAGGVTLNVNGLGALPVVGLDHLPLTAGALTLSGYADFELSDSANTFVMRSCSYAPSKSYPASSRRTLRR